MLRLDFCLLVLRQVILFYLAAGSQADHFIVLFKSDISLPQQIDRLQRYQSFSDASNHHLKRDGHLPFQGVKTHYRQSRAFSAHLHESVLQNITNDDAILLIEKDQSVRSHHMTRKSSKFVKAPIYSSEKLSDRSTSSYGRRANNAGMLYLTQLNARTVLVRLSHAPKNVNFSAGYIYSPTTSSFGAPMIYSFDSGVRLTHAEFQHRVISSVDFSASPETSDSFGHGTHVMAIALGQQFGVARNALGISVKTLDDEGSGNLSSVTAGIDWVLAQKGNRNLKVINLSFGGPYSTGLNKIVDDAIEAGIHVVVSAGNDNSDVANFSPASSERIITVGAIDAADCMTEYTNYGSLIDFVAPGNDVLSAWYESDRDTYISSGTSMAAPHVSGLIAYILSLRGPMSPARMREELTRLSFTNATGFPNGDTPRIVYNGSGE